MTRILLLETRHQERHRHHRAEVFPYLRGLARRMGWECQWWVVSVPRGHMHAGLRYVVDLPDETRARIAEELADWRPDTIIVHDRPADSLLDRIRQAAPESRVVEIEESTHDTRHGGAPRRLLGDGDEGADLASSEDGLLLDVIRPDFEQRLLGTEDDAGSDEERAAQPLRLAAELCCAYRRPVRDNPVYRDLDSDVVRAHEGCAFCLMPHGSYGRQFRTHPVEHTLRQVEAHQSASDDRISRFYYLMGEGSLGNDLLPFLRAVAEGDYRPSTFHVMPRADALLAQRGRWEDLLPLLQKKDHQVRLLSVGAENFSAEENLRFNKGVTAEQLWDCLDLMKDFEARFPNTFASGDPGYFAGILFTPWTRSEDLLVNLEAARRLGPVWLNKVIGIRLQMWEGAPITELARRDGLVVERLEGSIAHAIPESVSNANDSDVPWRFADAETERIHGLLIRLEPLSQQAALPKDDATRLEIRELRAKLPRWYAEDYIGMAAGIVHAVCARGIDAPISELFEAIAAEAEQMGGPPTGGHAVGRDDRQPPGDDRIGDPTASPADESSSPGSLLLVVQHTSNEADAAAGGEYRFHVATHRDTQPHLLRVGRLILWYSHPKMDRPATTFARMLRVVMRAMQRVPASAACLPEWQQTIDAVLRDTGMARRFRCTAHWAPPD